MISAYAPQTECTKEGKEAFWKEMDVVVGKLDKTERIFIGADFNGHVGEERWVGKYGLGNRNEEGKAIVEFATRMDLMILNTVFRKNDAYNNDKVIR